MMFASTLNAKSNMSRNSLRFSKQSSLRRGGNTQQKLVVRAGESFPQDWLKINPLVFVLGVAGWTVPSCIPVSALGNTSLFGAFTAEIGTELAKFPAGPSLDSPFWLYLISWHVGLFVTMLLGQVGFQGRSQKYW
eukprot:TRINITY_DN25_c0_g1_i1.p3 TRINITY_DN25_c0_g1~~TRINITY_DN25_c0_g1_i1.p3  ORF type:complete len:135 (+),score=27.68 TRINITY_DN25_c0_g1_i1:130-534(+)